MAIAKEEDIKVRVPTSLKVELQELADSRLTSISSIAREALLEYLTNQRAGQFREGEPPMTKPGKPGKSINYRKRRA